MTRKSCNQAVPAAYTPQRIARFQGNQFIEALPPMMDDDEVLAALTLLPDFSQEQRQWPNHERIQQLKALGNFMVPLTRHLELSRTLDSMVREGYVGRTSGTVEYVQKLRSIYLMQKAGKTFAQKFDTVPQYDATSLLGYSGMGKSTTIRRWLAHYPQVIFHESSGVTQVTYLHVDMKNNGDSVKALLIALITRLDLLLPEFGYAKLYLKDISRTSALSLIAIVSRLMVIHQVGILVGDEIQNLANHPKGAQQVMTELTTMCNELMVPIIFVGTMKAAQVLGADFRQGRRSVGMSVWNHLPRYDAGGEHTSNGERSSEWADFIGVLWGYQWVRTPLGLNVELLDRIYGYTQGIIDLDIKLFALAQVRAILEGTDQLTPEILERVYNEQFGLLHPMLDAMRTNNLRALAQYSDISPLTLEGTVEQMQSDGLRRKARARMTKPGDSTFVQQVGAALLSAGFGADQAHSLAAEIDADGTAKDTMDALRQACDKVKPALATKRTGVSKGSNKSSPKAVVWPDLAERPNDYRRALQLASENSTTVLHQLQTLGMACDVEELVSLD